MKSNRAFAEIIESSLNGWLAQSWQWDRFPLFGSLISITQQKRTLIGLVHHVKTGSMDPSRYPFAYQKTEEELRREQPQIFEFLKTTFSCIFLGYQENNRLFYTLAPEPAKIHGFVEQAESEICRHFFDNADYLHLLFGFAHQIDNLDELLLAMLSNAKKSDLLTQAQLASFIKTYAMLTGNDYRRIKLFLHRAQHIAL